MTSSDAQPAVTPSLEARFQAYRAAHPAHQFVIGDASGTVAVIVQRPAGPELVARAADLPSLLDVLGAPSGGVRASHMADRATPVCDGYFGSLDPAAAEAIAAVDRRCLHEEKARVAPWVAEKLTEPAHGTRRRMRMWERLTARIAGGWPPDGTCLADEYVNDLDTRDSLDKTAGELPAAVAGNFRAVLGHLDAAFRAATYDDGGSSIAWRMNESPSELELRPWWWRRRPANAPWA